MSDVAVRTKPCPRCGSGVYTPMGDPPNPFALFPALSRVDNATYICSECGTIEAMEDFTKGQPMPKEQWANPDVEADYDEGSDAA